MSLKIWLPLNGDLKNKGCSDVIITNNGATIDNNGKIGKCYYFNGSNQIKISLPDDMTTTKNTTVMAWVKSTGSVVALGGISYDNSTYGYSGAVTLYTSGWQFPASSGYKYVTGGSIANSQVWHHVACTIGDDIITTYLDGVVVTTNSLTTLTAVTTLDPNKNFIEIGQDSPGTDERLTGYVNDFRVYNHCLSINEIKEISKGLICHYKLDGFNSGVNPNMLLNIPKSYTPTAYCGYQLNFTENLVANETYTLQLWDVEVSHSAKTGSALGIWVYWGGGSTGLFSFTSANSELVNGKADYLVKTFTITSSQASGSGANNAWFNMYNSVGYVAGTLNMKIGKWKLEKGSIATPYCKTVSEIGIDTTKIIDSSGYNHHGIKNGTLTVNNDTAKNSLSTIFNGTNSYIEAEPLPLETKTISIWLKTSWITPSSGYRLAVHDKNTGLAVGFSSSGMFITYIGSSNGGLGSQIASSSMGYTANQWNHIVIVKTGDTTRDIYVNGVKKTPAGANYWGGDLNKLNIGARHLNSYSAYFDGQMSDFRAYATALSADDIKELYQVGAKIDKSGNMYGYELKED